MTSTPPDTPNNDEDTSSAADHSPLDGKKLLRGSVIDEDGNEVEITPTMIEKACKKLEGNDDS